MTAIDLDGLMLDRGSHDSWEAGACLLEAVSYLAGEPWSDCPACVSPVLGAYGLALNDNLPDDLRQELKPFIPRLVGTAGDGWDTARGILALDWIIRVYTPRWLELVPELVADADRLAALPALTEVGDVAEIAELVREIESRAAIATTWTVDEAMVRATTWIGTGDTAEARASVVALAVAGATVGAVAGNAALEAVGAVALEAVGAVALGATGTLLAPRADTLQRSAIDLFDRMIDPAGVAA